MTQPIQLEMSLEVAKFLAGLESAIRAEVRQEEGFHKIARAAKQATDTWVAGMKLVNAEQRPLIEGHRRWQETIEGIGTRYRGLREVMLDTTAKTKQQGDAWVAGLKTVSAEQQYIIQGQREWSSGLAAITTQYRTLRDVMLSPHAGGSGSAGWAPGAARLSADFEARRQSASAWSGGSSALDAIGIMGFETEAQRNSRIQAAMLGRSNTGLGMQEREAANLAAAAAETAALPAITQIPESVQKTTGWIDRMRSSLAGVPGELTQIAAGWVGIQTIIRTVNAMVAEHKQRTEEARTASVGLGQAQSAFIAKTAGESRASVDQALEILATQGRYATPEQMTTAGTAAAAAYGGDPVAAARATVAADRLALGDTLDMAALAKSAPDMAKATKVRDPIFNMGLGLMIGKYVRTEDPAMEAVNIAQALGRAAVVSQGDPQRNARQGGALYAYLTQMGVDISGETGAQAFAVEAEQMRQFFRDRGIADPGTSASRVQWFQSHPQAAQEFLDEARFGRERFKPAFEELFLRPGSEHVQQFYNVPLAELERADPATLFAEQERRRAGATVHTRQAARAAQTRATGERTKAARTPDAILAEANALRGSVMAQTRQYAATGPLAYATEKIGQGIDYGFGAMTDRSSMEFARNRIEFQLAEIYNRRQALLTPNGSNVGGETFGVPPRRVDQLSPQERTDLRLLEETRDTLAKMLDELQAIRQDGAIAVVREALSAAAVEMVLAVPH